MIEREYTAEEINSLFGQRKAARRAECQAAGRHDLSGWVAHPFIQDMLGRFCHRCDHRELRILPLDVHAADVGRGR